MMMSRWRNSLMGTISILMESTIGYDGDTVMSMGIVYKEHLGFITYIIPHQQRQMKIAVGIR